MTRVSAKEIIISLENMVDELKILLPKKETNYGNQFRFGMKQVAIRISEKADRIWYGQDDKVSTDTMRDTLLDVVGWAAIGRAIMVKELG